MDIEASLRSYGILLEFVEYTERSMPSVTPSRDDLERITDGLRTVLADIDTLLHDNSLQADKVHVLISLRANVHDLCPVWDGYLDKNIQEHFVLCDTERSGSRGRPRYIVHEEQVGVAIEVIKPNFGNTSLFRHIHINDLNS